MSWPPALLVRLLMLSLTVWFLLQFNSRCRENTDAPNVLRPSLKQSIHYYTMFEKQQIALGKFLSPGSKPTAESFPELPECITWMRFFLAVNYGIYMGFTVLDNSRGAVPLLMGLNFVAFAPMMYSMVVLQADNDSYAGKLLFVGLPNAMALVVLIWIYYYTMSHEEEEETLRRLLEAVKATQGTSGEDGSGGDPADVVEDVSPPMEESEF